MEIDIAGDVRGTRIDEELDDARDLVVSPSRPTGMRAITFMTPPPERLHHLGADEARRDRVDGDPLVRALAREAHGQPEEAAFDAE